MLLFFIIEVANFKKKKKKKKKKLFGKLFVLCIFFSMGEYPGKGPVDGSVLKVAMDYLWLKNAYRLKGIQSSCC